MTEDQQLRDAQEWEDKGDKAGAQPVTQEGTTEHSSDKLESDDDTPNDAAKKGTQAQWQ